VERVGGGQPGEYVHGHERAAVRRRAGQSSEGCGTIGGTCWQVSSVGVRAAEEAGHRRGLGPMAAEGGRNSDGALQEFCARLKRLQVMSGISQAALTGHAGLGRTQMSDVLNGNIRRVPDWDIVQAVVRACSRHAESRGIILPPDVGNEQAWRLRYADLEHREREDRSRPHGGHTVRYRGDGIPATGTTVASDGQGEAAAAAPEEFRTDLLTLLAKLDEAACRGNLPGYLPAGADVSRMARTVRLLGRVRQPDRDSRESAVRRTAPATDARRMGAYRLPAEGDAREDQPPMPWEEVAAAHDRIVVLADPGIGKSWLLRAHAHRLAQAAREGLNGSPVVPDDAVIPVPVRADVLAASPGSTLAEGVTGYLMREGLLPIRSVPLMQQWITAGRVVLLIDALDEVPRGAPAPGAQAPRKRLDDLLHDWASRCSGAARCVLATRLAGYSGPPVPGAQEAELLPFSAEDAQAVIKAWDLPGPAQDRVNRWLGDPAVSGMTRLPLLLALICSLAAREADRGPLPDTRAGLYEAVLWQFLSAVHRSSDRGGPAAATSPEERQDLLRILAQVAYAFASTSRGWVDLMPYNQLVEIVAAADKPLAALRGSPAAVLGRLTAQAGVLVPAGNPAAGDQPYMFLHRTVAEHLVALYLRDIPSEQRMRTIAGHQWFDPDWAEIFPILGGLMAARLPSDAQAVVSCFLNQRRDPLDRGFHTALRIIGESRDSNRLLPSGQTHNLRKRILNLLAGEISRSRLLRTLASVAAWPEAVTDAMLSSLRIHGDIRLKIDVIGTLAGRDGIAVTVALLAQLNHEVAEVRRAAAWALAGRQDSGVTEGLLERLGDVNRSVRVAIAKALAGRNDRATTEALLVALGRGNENARNTVVMALNGRDDQMVADGLLAWMSDDDHNVRLAAARALTGHRGDDVTNALLAALADDYPWVRSQAIHALAGRQGDTVTPALLSALADDDWLVRHAACTGLASRSGPEVTNALLAGLADRDNNMRHTAVWALADRLDHRVTESLLAQVSAEDHFVGDAALKVLAKRDSSEVTEGLVAYLSHSDTRVRRTVAEVLAERPGQDVTDALLTRLGDKDHWVRSTAASALAGRDGRAVTEGLLARLTDDDGLVRGAAVRALAGRDDPAVTAALLDRLKDSDTYVRQAVIRALAGRNDPIVTRALLDRLSDRRRDIRQAAVEALAGWDDPAVTPALLARLKDRSSFVRFSAVQALAGRQEPAVIDGLLGRLKDRDLNVRSSAVRMLARQDDPAILARACRRTIWALRPFLREATFDLADRIADGVYLKLPTRKRSQIRRRLGRLTNAIHGRRSEFRRQQQKLDEARARWRLLSPFP
jgi:HEAT repeat protein